MMLSIAIISLILFVVGISISILKAITNDSANNPRLGYLAIAVIAWWDICFPVAIITLVVGSILVLIALCAEP